MLSKVFDNCDYLLDSQRSDNLKVWTDETYISSRPALKVFSRLSLDRYTSSLLEGLNSCVMCLMYHDAKSS